MKISIIVPIYNIEKYISKCIDSVLAQTYKDWELILVDDGSTDNSGKICDEYALKDSRIKVIHKKNEGVTATRNRGVKEAKGEFLFFIDGDDYITENTLELFINKQKENDADLVRGSHCEIYEDGNIIKKHIVPSNVNCTKNWLKFIIINEIWGMVNTLYKSHIFKTNVNIPSNIVIGEDLIYTIQYGLKIKEVNNISDITYYYIQRNTSVMHQKNFIKKKDYTVFFEWLKEIEKVKNSFKYINNYECSNLLEYLISIRIYKNPIPKTQINQYKSNLLYYYNKYFSLNIKNQLYILKQSPITYLKMWKKYILISMQ